MFKIPLIIVFTCSYLSENKTGSYLYGQTSGESIGKQGQTIAAKIHSDIRDQIMQNEL